MNSTKSAAAKWTWKLDKVFPKTTKKKLCYTAFAGLFASCSASAQQNYINFQGFSGLINVPTGTVMDYGEIQFSHNNLVDSQLGKHGDFGTQYTDGNVNIISVSPFPGLEFSIRNIGSDTRGEFNRVTGERQKTRLDNSDLSANIKYSPTFIPDDWFDLAIGIQDLGGNASSLDAQFVSVSKQLWDFRLTAGIGNNKDAEKLNMAPRYEGGFWGIEYQPFDWLTVIAEDDGANQSAAIRLSTPTSWLWDKAQFYTTVVASDNFDDNQDNIYFGAGIRASLFSSVSNNLKSKKEQEYKIADAFDWLFSDSDYQEYQAIDIGLSEYQHANDKLVSQLGLIKNKIAKQGFERVWLGLDEDKLLLRFENSVFNRNDIDALGVVLGVLAGMAQDNIKTIDVTLSKFDVPTLRFEVEKEQLKDFYQGHNERLDIRASEARKRNVGDMLWVGGSRSPYWVPRFSFEPVIRNFVGTELGVYDYSLALRSNMALPIMPGLELTASYDTHIHETGDFELGRSFYRWRRDDGLNSVMLNQTIKLPFDIYSTVSIGRANEMFNEEHDIVALNSRWQSPTGAHRISIYGAYMDNTQFDVLDREIYTAEYRYYWESLNTSFQVEAGQFWRQDKGIKLSSVFNMGDTRVTLYAQDTDVALIGFDVSIPLTPRRDMRPSFFQLKGADTWTHGIATKVNGSDNALSPQRGYRPNYLRYIDERYFNDDRLSISYIKANVSRLRNAYKNLTR